MLKNVDDLFRGDTSSTDEKVWIALILDSHALSARHPGVKSLVWRSDVIPQVSLDGAGAPNLELTPGA
jgi:hypothetical protein